MVMERSVLRVVPAFHVVLELSCLLSVEEYFFYLKDAFRAKLISFELTGRR